MKDGTVGSLHQEFLRALDERRSREELDEIFRRLRDADSAQAGEIIELEPLFIPLDYERWLADKRWLDEERWLDE